MRLGFHSGGVEEDAMLEAAVVVVQNTALLTFMKVLRIPGSPRRIVFMFHFKPMEGWR